MKQHPIALKKPSPDVFYQAVPAETGFGTPEDSMASVIALQPKPPKFDMKKMFKQYMHVLRFNAKLVSTDVRKLAGQLKDTVAVSTWSAEEGGVSVFDALGAAALHLDEYATTRAPILQWSSAKCLSGLGVGPAGGAVPSLGECLSPLTRDVTPLLGKCLVHSPWRVCRLAMRYVAFVWTRALASAAGQPEEWARKKGQLLANLLEEVDGVLNFDTPEAENPLAALGDVVRGCMRTVATAFNGGAVDESELTTCRMRSNGA